MDTNELTWNRERRTIWFAFRFKSGDSRQDNFRRKKRTNTIQCMERAMAEFSDVTVVKEANVYFDGKVTSRTILFPDSSKRTLGIMLPGEYTFNTELPEIMEIISGELEVLLPGAGEWKTIKGGERFEVPAHSRFELKIRKITDYCCSFIS